jgi:hypothetical protein
MQPIADGLAANDCRVLPLTLDDAWDIGDLDLLLLYGPMQPLTETIGRLKSLAHVPPLVFWFTEQVPNPALPDAVVGTAARLRHRLQTSIVRATGRSGSRRSHHVDRLLRRAGRLRAIGELLALRDAGWLAIVATFTETQAGALRRHGLPATVVPIGYHPSFGQLLDREREVDVTFLGTLRDRRRRGIVARLEGELEERGVRLAVHDGSPERPYIAGPARTLLLNRSKILLNVMRQPWDDPVHRMLLAGANGAMLLSEPLHAASRGPFEPGVHLVELPVDRLADGVVGLLADRGARERIARQAHALITGELTTEAMARRLLAQASTAGQPSIVRTIQPRGRR